MTQRPKRLYSKGVSKGASMAIATGSTYFERERQRIRILAGNPFLGCDGRIFRQCIGIEILLEEIRFARHRHRDDLAETIVVQPIEFGYFAGGYIAATLRHQTNAALWVWSLKCVDVVHKWRFWCHLKTSTVH